MGDTCSCFSFVRRGRRGLIRAYEARLSRLADPEKLWLAAGRRNSEIIRRPITDEVSVDAPIVTCWIGGLLDGVALAAEGLERESEIRTG